MAHMRDVLVLTIVAVFSAAPVVFCGECCLAYTDITGTDHDAKWCSDYCCHEIQTLGLTLTCCDNVVLRAAESNRDDFCAAWFASHAYVPAIVSIAIVAAIVTCCFCCCCRRRQHGVIIQQSGGMAGPTVVVQQQQQQQMQPTASYDPYRVGYDQ